MNPGQNHYPINQFPLALGKVIHSIMVHTQAPASLVGTVLIGSLAESVQALVDVQLPDGQLCTTSMWTLAIADSGSGKTPVMKMSRQSIVAFEQKMAMEHATKLADYNRQLMLWKAKQKALEGMLRSQVRRGQDTQEIEQTITEHLAKEPLPPKLLKISYPDATPEALIMGMSNNSPNVSIANDEASKIFNGHMANGLASLNQGWDGQPLTVDRRTLKETIIVPFPRVTLNLALQSALMEKYFKKRGTEIRDLGSLQRCLISRPPNDPCLIRLTPTDTDVTRQEEYNNRLTALLQQGINEHGEPIESKQVMHFSPAATYRFHKFCEELAQDTYPGGPLENVRDYVAKAPRNAAKLAALFARFESDTDTITEEMLGCAIQVINWYIDEFQMVMTMPTELEITAKDFIEWLLDFAEKRGNRYLIQNDILKHAPSKLRSSARLNDVLNLLAEQDLIQLFECSGLNVINVQPHLGFHELALTSAIFGYRARRAKYR